MQFNVPNGAQSQQELIFNTLEIYLGARGIDISYCGKLVSSLGRALKQVSPVCMCTFSCVFFLGTL